MMSEKPWGQVYAERGEVITADNKRRALRIVTKGNVGQGYTVNPSTQIKIAKPDDPAAL